MAADAPLDQAVAQLFALGCRNVVVTLGADGCRWSRADGMGWHCSTVPLKPIDTVGTGDSFCAALAVGLAEGMAVRQALHFANVAAALSVTIPDTIPSHHRRPAVKSLLAQHPCPA